MTPGAISGIARMAETKCRVSTAVRSGWALRRAASTLLLVVGCTSVGDDVSTTVEILETTVQSTATSTASTSTTVEETVTSIPPITGYGDFSGLEYFEVDSYLTVALVVQCMHDHGFPVNLIPPGDGYGFGSIPPQQNKLAQVYGEACWAGLNLPSYQDPDPGQREEIYEYFLALRDCLIGEGYDVAEPPSQEYFVENYNTDPWSPYASVGYAGPSWQSIEVRCPQQPTGGYAAWEPGDPITPITPPEG